MPDQLPSICFVAPNAFPLLSGDEQTPLIGGAELQQVLVATGLAKRGYRISMVCRDFGQPNGIECDGVTVFRTFRLDRGIPGLRFLWPRLTRTWRGMSAADADIYYQRTAGMLTGVVAEFCRRYGKRSVFAAAGNPDLERNTSRIRFTRDRWIYEYGLRHVDAIIVQNDEQAELCKTNFGRNALQIKNCYPAVHRKTEVPGNAVLWVSTIRQIKQPQLFLELAESMPNHQFRMIGGPGRGEEALYRSIEERARKIANLEFQGFVPYSRIDAEFDKAVAFVNTSESEGFPNTFLQAWSRGIPTIAFIDSGARAAGQPIGLQVDSLDAMRESLSNWLMNEGARAKDGDRCLDYFELNHSPNHVLDLYERLFMQLASNRGSGAHE